MKDILVHFGGKTTKLLVGRKMNELHSSTQNYEH